MIPIRDENPTRRLPWLTLVIIGANLAVFAYELTLGPDELWAFWTRWALVPSRFLADPFSTDEAVTLVTSMFMHGGWIHVIGNMLYLWIFGNNIEDRFGAAGFAAFYLATGLGASAAQILSAPGSAIPTLGASGAVAGVLGAYLLLYPGASVVTIIPIFVFIEVARVPAFLVIGFWFVLQLGSGLASLGAATADTGGVAWFAHIGGFALGLLLTAPVAIAQRGRRKRR
jgi:membrane associated rhomboid family serine protease